MKKYPKPPAEILTYWLKSVHFQARKQNLKPNIVLLLTGTDSMTVKERRQRIISYTETIIDMVQGKAYADYISQRKT